VTDWGIPDWRDPTAYGDTKRWSEFRWRWEFTRRREDCRADFLAHKEDIAHKWRFLDEVPLQPHERGFVAKFPGCYEKYGLIGLPNPAIGDQPLRYIMVHEVYPRQILFDAQGRLLAQETVLETEAVLVFDLSASIDNQLEIGKGLLKWLHEVKFGRPVSRRRHPDKWLRYLRVLDAKESGASWSQIGKAGVLGNLSRGGAHAARDAWNQADALRFNWPR